jgi:enamine deaminase RidA (YjgF/YER057c/UK114 family)
VTRVAERLAALGLTLPPVARPVAAYLPAIRDGRYVYVSGQLPIVAGTMHAVGRVGVGEGLVAPELAAECARLSAINAIAALASVVESLDEVERIVKVVGFVASDPSFTGQPLVVNGASILLGEVFGDAGTHARSAVGVVALPLDAPVEIELVAAIR